MKSKASEYQLFTLVTGMRDSAAARDGDVSQPIESEGKREGQREGKREGK